MYKFQFPRSSGGSRGAGGETRHSTPTVTEVKVSNICHPESNIRLRRKKKEGHREKRKDDEPGSQKKEARPRMAWDGCSNGLVWDGGYRRCSHPSLLEGELGWKEAPSTARGPR